MQLSPRGGNRRKDLRQVKVCIDLLGFFNCSLIHIVTFVMSAFDHCHLLDLANSGILTLANNTSKEVG